MEKILVSSCLLGNNCKYNGGNNYNVLVEELKKKYEIISICPEVMGGLSIPRVPSESINGTVINKDGEDVTRYFMSGSKKVLDIVKSENIKIAVLKDGSPSCGSSYIYDGTFSGNKISGMGMTAKLLKLFGVKIYSENNIEELL
ncbi:MAG: DUF523 domain-containing protein [Acholeplasmatales bacterium]|nr:DUF523 domain-containing protein [Acholeplasmatales bacterium]